MSSDEELFSNRVTPSSDLDDINDFLAGGLPGAAFDEIGDEWTGTVISAERVQQTDYDTGVPVTWDDGQPKMMLHIDIATEVRDEEIVGDDGSRRLYVRGNLLTAVRQAMRAAKVRLEPGCILTVKYVDDGTPPKKGMNAPKLYEATIQAAPTGIDADELV
jgi:hypothetical protein